VAALVFLIVGVVCSLIARILLFRAALRISVSWAIGVLVPFGPIVFGLAYPEEARASRMVRFAALPCLFFYVLLGPGPALKRDLGNRSASFHPFSYGVEKGRSVAKGTPKPGGPSVELTPSPDERRASNTRDFEHLRAWGEALRLKKRDLLHSDVAGNAAYAIELAQYNAAMEKAKADRATLWPLVPK
jgi:hypothetical protein